MNDDPAHLPLPRGYVLLERDIRLRLAIRRAVALLHEGHIRAAGEVLRFALVLGIEGQVMTDLATLITYLAEASEGTRQLDSRVWFAVRDERGSEPVHERTPAFTRSVDAALQLIPSGWFLRSLREFDQVGEPDGRCRCTLHPHSDNDIAWDKSDGGVVVRAATLPLALCLAALTVRKVMS